MHSTNTTVWSLFLLLLTHAVGNSALAEAKRVFDYAAQRAASNITKVVFIAAAEPHGDRGNHEFVAGSILLARQLNSAYSNVQVNIYSNKNWPADLSDADAVVVALNHGGRAARDPHIGAAVRRGVGFMAIHFGLEVNQGEEGERYLQWLGGYFETYWSVNPWWTPQFKEFPAHPIARGVKPFSVRDEWYYHMRFVQDMRGVTPILSDVPPLSTVNQAASPRGGNPTVYEAVSKKQPQHMAWAYERLDGGRGFGFTGLHLHSNLKNDSYRTVLLNGVAWVARLNIPPGGVPSKTPSAEELSELINEARAGVEEGH